MPAALFAAFLLSAGVGIVLLATGRAGRRSKVPFGPFLAAGALVVIALAPAG